MDMELNSEKEKKYQTIAKFCRRNGVREAKILLDNGSLVEYVSRRKTLDSKQKEKSVFHD